MVYDDSQMLNPFYEVEGLKMLGCASLVIVPVRLWRSCQSFVLNACPSAHYSLGIRQGAIGDGEDEDVLVSRSDIPGLKCLQLKEATRIFVGVNNSCSDFGSHPGVLQ